MKKLDRFSSNTRTTEGTGAPTRFHTVVHQNMCEAIEALASAGDLEDLPGGATTADIIVKVNQILNIARSIA